MTVFLKALLGVLLFFAPFSFAAAEPWAFSVLQGGIFAGLLLTLFSRRQIVYTKPLKWLFFTFAFLIGYTLLQALFTQTLLDPPAWYPATLMRLYTLEHASWFVTYLALLVWVPNVWESFKSNRILLFLIVLCGFAVGLCALGLQKSQYIQFFTGVKAGFGPFLNRNHAGVFLGMCALITLGYAVSSWTDYAHFRANRRGNEFILRQSFLGLVFVGLCALVVATRSRGGMLSLGVGIFFYSFLCCFFVPQEKNTRLKGVLLVVVLLAAAAAVVWWQADAINAYAQRATGASEETRKMLYRSAWAILQIYPWWGIGVGAMPVAITSFMEYPLNAYVERLHSDWLEMLLGMGFIGYVFVLACAAITAWILIKRISHLERKKQFLYASLLSALVVMCVGSTVDFHFFIPANAFLFFVILGLSCSPSYYKGHVHTLSCGPVLTAAVCLAMAAALYWPTQHTVAWRLFVFGKGLKPESQIALYQQGLGHYPSPRFALRLGNAYYNYSRRAPDAQQSAALRSQAHQTAAAYLEKYPKEKELSKLYMISLPN